MALLPGACGGPEGPPMVDATGMGRALPEVHQVGQTRRRAPLRADRTDRSGRQSRHAAPGRRPLGRAQSRALSPLLRRHAAMADYVMSVGEAAGMRRGGGSSAGRSRSAAESPRAEVDPVAAWASGARRALTRGQDRRRRATHPPWGFGGGACSSRATGPTRASVRLEIRTRTSWRSRKDRARLGPHLNRSSDATTAAAIGPA